MNRKQENGGILGHSDIAPLYSTEDMQRRIKAHRERIDRINYKASIPFIAKRTSGRGKTVQTIVVMAQTMAEAMPKMRAIATSHFKSLNAPWIINNGDSFYS